MPTANPAAGHAGAVQRQRPWRAMGIVRQRRCRSFVSGSCQCSLPFIQSCCCQLLAACASCVPCSCCSMCMSTSAWVRLCSRRVCRATLGAFGMGCSLSMAFATVVRGIRGSSCTGTGLPQGICWPGFDRLLACRLWCLNVVLLCSCFEKPAYWCCRCREGQA